MERNLSPTTPSSPGRHVGWGRGGASPGPSSRDVSRGPSQTPSRRSSPLNSAASSTNGEGTERPSTRRTTSKLQAFRRVNRPRYLRAKSSTLAPTETESGVPLTAIARLARRTNNNLRMWRLRYSNGKSSRRTEVDKLRELERGEMLFAQQLMVLPSLLVAASAMHTSDRDEKKVPVLLQQLSIKVTEESAKHFRNMLRIHLEYGGGFALIEWQIVRGYRDLLLLRARLKADNQGFLGRKHKIPRLPRPKAFGKYEKPRHMIFARQQTPYDENDDEYDGIGEDELAESSESEDDEEPAARDAGNNLAATTTSNSLVNAASRQPSSYGEAVEIWLQKVQLIYMLRPDSNSLMHFLELSHLSMKLASEYSFHGKEGTLVVRSRASELGWHVNHLQPRDFKDMIERHTRKWVLVRDSYIVVVDNIYSTRIREVFEVDSHFKIEHIEEKLDHNAAAANERGDMAGVAKALADLDHRHKKTSSAKSVFLHLSNNARDLKLAAATERELRQWQVSIFQMKNATPWSNRNRFESFAPVRKNVFGQWFVDGRDYMWVLSEALENARDTIFILDWWLSPELYLRRPPEGNQKWRLDRVLKRKAQQGVKIFVVVYRNVGPTIPIDSTWTKHSLLDLHENIHIIRSPNQLSNKSSLFWAHHEKLCVIDTTVAFNGGVDLCYGRWDTWQHVLTDDAPSAFLAKDPTSEQWSQRTQLFPGKDYSNARVKDFYELNKPFDDMYDRNHVPRMPWHDIHQMVVGQPARDLARHFVQRWNFVVRNKIPSRWTPLLLPPADFTKEDLERLQLTGTCEYQVLRSSGDWSLGLRHHEQSIQNAYIKLIEESEHLVYIENQFFITSTEVDGVMIENQIGNALVQRIVRAHERGEPWKAFILIPLMPGFEAEVDTDKASSVRVICQCQFNSISRGPNSIFYRLESLGIRPDRYIHFFSLRKWGKFSNTPDAPNEGRICSELLYIHAKCMIVDDRIAIIGSANINERSMRGLRDSELAVCVRDTKVVESQMAGKPWKAAKFAHSLRVRLMREHLGVDIDKMEIIERLTTSLEHKAMQVRRAQAQQYRRSSEPSEPPVPEGGDGAAETDGQFPAWLYPELHTFNWYAGTNVNRGIRDHKKLSRDSRVQGNPDHKADVEGDGYDHWKERDHQAQSQETRYRAELPDVEMENEAREIMSELLRNRSIKSRDEFMRVFYAKFTKQNILRPLKRAGDLPLPHTDEDGLKAVNNESIPIDPWKFQDPLNEQFVNDKWLAAAERNTLIYRLVFRCQPDDEVETWKDYKTFSAHLERFYAKQREDGGPDALRQSGHHEPERVDKHVLDGSIRKTNPEFLKWPNGFKPNVQFPNVQLPNVQLPSVLPNMPWQAQQKPLDAEAGVPVDAAGSSLEPVAVAPSEVTAGDGVTTGQMVNGSADGAAVNGTANGMVTGGTALNGVPADGAVYAEESDRPRASSIPSEHLARSTVPGIAVNDDMGTDFEIRDGDELHHRHHHHHHHHHPPHHHLHHHHREVDGNEHAPQGLPDKVAHEQKDRGDARDERIINGTANGKAAPSEDGTGYFDSAVNSTESRQGSEEREDRHPHLQKAEGYIGHVHSRIKNSNKLRNMETYALGAAPSENTGRAEDEFMGLGSASESRAFESASRLQPTQSSASGRRRAFTMSGSATSSQKPARKWGHFDHVLDAQVAEDMLQGITGHLVTFPTEWLNRELDSGNWNFQLDRIAPLEIYD